MSDAKTLTAEEIDSRMNACGAGGTGVWRLGIEGVAAQAKRVPELEAEIARLTAVLRFHNFARCDTPACNCGSWHQRGGLVEERDRYRKVAELALAYRRGVDEAFACQQGTKWSDEIDQWPNEAPLDAALAAVGMKP